ncbi:MAG: outer membrane protein assembly factor BamB family protein [Planctomycetota bacterium]|jgi:outer membrane protein assembly factor BamB
MFRNDAARSAYTTNRVPTTLQLVWKRPARHRPSPAWSRQPRLEYDHTYHPVLAGGLLFFGSSTDHKAYALDAASGREVWTFFTDAPIRVAPAVSEHGVYVGSDDGVLYCLDVKSGRLKWKVRAAPRDDRIMGNDRLISRWPVRGGPAVRDGIVYFAAGIWPTEGVYVYALDARDGKVIWRNDTVGSLVSDKPRAGRQVRSGPAAQGHLAVGDGVLVVPTGRGAPAVFDLADGGLKHFHHALYVNKASGGTKAAVLAGGQAPANARPALTGVGELARRSVSSERIVPCLVVCGENYPLGRERRTRLCTPDDGRNVAAQVTAANADHPKMIVTGTPSGLAGFAKKIVEKERRERDGKVTKYLSLPRDPVWTCKTPFEVRDVVATEGLLVLGGDGEIAVLEIDTRKVLGRAKVAGKVQSLAVANRCVYAAAEDGSIYCFSASGGNRSAAAEKTPSAPGDRGLAAVARDILNRTRLTRGYCLDIGCGEGSLAYELVSQSGLYVYGVDTDVRKVRAARECFDRLRLYGTRATFLHVDDLGKLPFIGRFAELVVSSKALTEAEGQALSRVRPALTGVGDASLDADEVRRMLCPYLGVSCLGRAGELTVTPRGPVKGAGNWTHFYADAQNSYCGTDTALRGPMELLWFRDTDYEMANRHSMSNGHARNARRPRGERLQRTPRLAA